MNPAISGLYAVTPELADTAVLLAKTQAALAGGAHAVAIISALFAVPDVEATARKFCQLLRAKVI